MKLSEAIEYAERATGKASEPLRLLAAAARESVRLQERADVACADAGEAEHRVRRVENKLRRTMKNGPFVFVPETQSAFPHIEDCCGGCVRSFSTGENEYAKETCDMLNAAVGSWAARILGVKPCGSNAPSAEGSSAKAPTTTACKPSSTSTPDAGSNSASIAENLKHLREIVEHNIPGESTRNEAAVVLDLLEADIREARQ